MNELLTERGKNVGVGNDGLCVCEKRETNMFADWVLYTYLVAYDTVTSMYSVSTPSVSNQS